MSQYDRAKIADLLDAVAEYVDDVESQKTAAEQSARNERVEKLAQNYSVSTGEALPNEFKLKLASLDPTTLDHLLKVAKNNTESPDALGKPADADDTPAPRTVKEAAENAEKRFLDFLIND